MQLTGAPQRQGDSDVDKICKRHGRIRGRIRSDGEPTCVCRRRRIQELLLAAKLAQNGLTSADAPGKDVHIIYHSYPDLNQALLGKNVDAILQTEPQDAQVINKKFGVEVPKPYDTSIGEPIRKLVMTEKFYKDNRPVAGARG